MARWVIKLPEPRTLNATGIEMLGDPADKPMYVTAFWHPEDAQYYEAIIHCEDPDCTCHDLEEYDEEEMWPEGYVDYTPDPYYAKSWQTREELEEAVSTISEYQPMRFEAIDLDEVRRQERVNNMGRFPVGQDPVRAVVQSEEAQREEDNGHRI